MGSGEADKVAGWQDARAEGARAMAAGYATHVEERGRRGEAPPEATETPVGGGQAQGMAQKAGSRSARTVATRRQRVRGGKIAFRRPLGREEE